MRTFKNYTEYIGKKYHRLTITDYKRKNKNVYFICKCDCGNVIETIGNNVITGKSQSCGCLRNERITKSNSKKKQI